MSRKNLFADLPTPITSSGPPPAERPFQGTAGPMSAIKRSVGDLNDRSRRAEEIEKSLTDGQMVVEIDGAFIDPSFVLDRMEGEIDALRESIREQGQQVPILVRLHPEDAGRYQVAFGHRRLRALKELGLKAKAVVRELTDEQLVIAQGQENNQREDLTFIEKARFAARLRERFTREIIISSMSVDRARLSKMLSIVDAIPAALIDAIGPAPGVGLLSWQQMAGFVEKASDPAGVVSYASSSDVRNLGSADRFKAILALRNRKAARALPGVMATSSGDRLAQVTQSKVKLEISIDKRAKPDFAAFVLEQLPALYEAHLTTQKLKTGE